MLVNDPPRFTTRPETLPRIGLCRTHLWSTAQPETVEAVENTARALARAGATVVEVGFPASFARLSAERAVINAYERFHSLAHEWHHGRDAFSPQMLATCEKGASIRRAEYVQALRFAAECRRAVGALFDNVDVLLAPCVPGEAPEGLDYAGDPRFQEIWTMLHVPTLTLPAHRGPRGLPVGIQLVAPHYEEGRLFAAARWVEARLAAA